MVLIIIFASLFVGGIIAISLVVDFDSGGGLLVFLITVLSGIALVVSVIMYPLLIMSVKAEIIEFESVIQTLENARANGDNIENAALQLKIAECNEWLVYYQYYNRTVFGLWIPDEVDELEPIR